MKISQSVFNLGGRTVLRQDIPTGTTFLGVIGGIQSLFLKTFSGTVDLKDPENTWAGSDDARYLSYSAVERYTPVDVVITTVEGK
jgi:hypothetical protein